LAKKINANGIHISDYDKIPIKFLRKSSFPKDFIFSFATHSLKSVIFCNKIKPNMAFISPIFESSSHKNTKYLGNLNLAKIAFQKRKLIFYPLKLYSLGGINLKNIKKIIKSNSCGFGAIDLFKEK
jgi:thiamine monophosphate synthase